MIRLLLRALLLLLCCPAVAFGLGDPVVERVEPSRLGGAHPMGFGAYEDAEGVLYLANVDGLVRVSGSRVQIFPLGSAGLVRTLLPVGRRIFVGGYDAFGVLEPNADGLLTLRDLSSGEPLGTVWRVIALGDDVHVVTGSRLITLRGEQRRELATPERTTAAFVLRDRLYLRAEGIGLLLLSEDGLHLTPVEGSALLGDGALRAALPWQDAVLLATEKHGLQRFDGRELNGWPSGPLSQISDEQPYALHRVPDGRLLVGTLAGRLHLIDADGRWLQAHELVSAPILGISDSREGGLLVSTERGLFRVYWPGAWARISAERGLEGAVRGVVRHEGTFWLATSIGVYRWRDAATQSGFERLTREIVDLRTISLVDATPVFSSELGLHVWRDGQLGPALRTLGSCYLALASAYHPGRIYGACDDGLLVAALQGGELRVLAEARGALARTAALDEVSGDTLLVTLLDAPPRRVRLGPSGEVIGDDEAGGGLPANAPATTLYRADVAPDSRHRALAAGRVWAWDGAGWQPHSEPWPVVLGDGQDAQVLLDARGNELLLTRRGLALRRFGEQVWRRVNLPGGAGVQIIGGTIEDALYLWDHERIWRAPLDGTGDVPPALTRVDAAGFPGLFAEPVSARVQIDRVQVDDGRGPRELSPSLKDVPPFGLGAQLTVEVSLPTQGLPTEFRSRLGSTERPGEFSSWTADATRVLPPLPQGRFRLEVEGRNAIGVIAAPVVLEFRVAAPWWHSRMLMILVGLVLFALVASAVLVLRSILLKRRFRQLELLVRERTEALSAANRQLTLQANSDGLTGLLNRRRFDADWASALRAAGEAGRPVALLLIDLDHFKRFNDRHGHLMGDERLRACADWLAELAETTPGATAYRYGGEEFVTILTQTDMQASGRYAVALCEGAERRFGPDGTTLSAGVRCAVPGVNDDPLDWLAAADAALYAAKHAGRNRVHVHQAEGPATEADASAGT